MPQNDGARQQTGQAQHNGVMTRRWPDWVYDEGEEPDYRFSFANERTFLAWVRTSLALVAAGVALDVVDLSISSTAQDIAALALVVLGIVTAGASWVRWALSERSMRRGDPLPSFGVGVLFAVVLVAAAVVLLVAGL
jgi:putative membrane protein